MKNNEFSCGKRVELSLYDDAMVNGHKIPIYKDYPYTSLSLMEAIKSIIEIKEKDDGKAD